MLRHSSSSPKTLPVVLILKPSLQNKAEEEVELQPPQPRMQLTWTREEGAGWSRTCGSAPSAPHPPQQALTSSVDLSLLQPSWGSSEVIGFQRHIPALLCWVQQRPQAVGCRKDLLSAPNPRTFPPSLRRQTL